MHPREVDQLYPDEYRAMVDYAVKVQRDERRAMRKAERGRR
jgi:hypothetical protein